MCNLVTMSISMYVVLWWLRLILWSRIIVLLNQKALEHMTTKTLRTYTDDNHVLPHFWNLVREIFHAQLHTHRHNFFRAHYIKFLKLQQHGNGRWSVIISQNVPFFRSRMYRQKKKSIRATQWALEKSVIPLKYLFSMCKLFGVNETKKM